MHGIFQRREAVIQKIQRNSHKADFVTKFMDSKKVQDIPQQKDFRYAKDRS